MWFDISFSVEVENKDVLAKLFDELSQLVCDGHGAGVDNHECRRQWVGSYKSIPEVDEDTDATAGSVAAPLELSRTWRRKLRRSLKQAQHGKTRSLEEYMR